MIPLHEFCEHDLGGGEGRERPKENLPEQIVARGRFVAHHDMHQLMLRHQAQPLGRGQRFKNQMEWLDAHLNEIGGDRSGASISGVIEILDQDGDFALRFVTVFLAIELLRIFE